MSGSGMDGGNLVSLPRDILITFPEYLHNIEDYMNLSSTCRRLRECMATATPNMILRLAAAQSRVFFRPSPLFLVAATARELGSWARLRGSNEKELADRLENGVDALMDLALDHCGLTMERIRDLHLKRFSILNPVEDIIDKCVGKQWYASPKFWSGGVDDAYTIHAEPSDTLFHLIIYGELFGADFEPILDQDTQKRRLGVPTRLEFIKYCLPDFACHLGGDFAPDKGQDPRRTVKETGPYKMDSDERYDYGTLNNNLALTWVIKSSRWKPHWKAIRKKAGPEFQNDFDDGWWYDEDNEQDWRQRMWEDILICQGLEGLEMMRDGMQDRWIPKIKAWREKISRLDREPATVMVGRQGTLEYPFLLGDLRCCVSGYCPGT